MGYYRLLPIAIWTADRNGVSILDVTTSQRIHFSREDGDFLEKIFSGECDYDLLEEREREILDKLMEEGYCYVYDKIPYNDDHQEKRGTEVRGLNEEIPRFSKIYLEVNNEDPCQELMPSDLSYGCKACMKWKRKKSPNGKNALFSIEDLIQRISQFWVDKIVLSGGNPLANAEEVIKYVKLIRQFRSDVEIEIYLPVTEIADETIELLKENKVGLNFTVLIGDREECIKIWECLKQQEIKVRFSCVGAPDQDFLNLCQSRGINVEILDRSMQLRHPEDDYVNRMGRNEVNYWKNQKFHPCLNGVLAITADGKVRPCPQIDDDLLDLGKEKLDVLFQKQMLDQYWRFTKRETKLCGKCRNKFFCEDCAALEFAVNNGIMESSILCDCP